MKYTLLVLPLLASVASAQDDVWKLLSKGDRVQITFRTGNMIMGNLVHRPADPRVKQGAIDYSAVDELTLDVSLEYPGLNGTMTILKKDIKEVRKIQSMDPATMKRVREELQRIQQQSVADEAARKTAESERDKAATVAREKLAKDEEAGKTDKEKGAVLLKDFQDLQKGKELLQRFPPDKFGPQTIKEMADMAVRKQPVPLEYREFADPEVQRLWSLALAASKEAAASEKKDAEKKEKVEEKKQ
jgi:hypothetical protein